MRPAIEVWRDAQDAWFGMAWEQPDTKRAAAVIVADRAELVAEIVAWMRDEANGWMCADTASSEIEDKFGGRDDR